MKIFFINTKKGMALFTTLITLIILFILATSFIGFTSSDYRFAVLQYNNTTAFYLAKAGLEFAAKGDGMEGKVEEDIYLPYGSNDHYCHVTYDKDSNGFIIAEGRIVTFLGGNEVILSKRTIVAPITDPNAWYEIGR